MNDLNNNLRLEALAIGSLPHCKLQDAMDVVERDFSLIPFFPQLSNVNSNEDMMVQFLEGLPSFRIDDAKNFLFDTDSVIFYSDLESFLCDYEEIMANSDSACLEKYAITEKTSSTFKIFESIISKTHPVYAKGQITGPFTLSTVLNNTSGVAAVFDDTLRDIILKHLSLKAVWEIKRIISANKDTIPIIFMDEPSISQIGTSSYLTITEDAVVFMINEISRVIKSQGGISAIHCCGKCDWRIPIKAGVDIINFDAYSFIDNFLAYSDDIKRFLENGGKIAWGFVPTISAEVLESVNVDCLESKFCESVKYLTNKGISEKLVIDNSLITSSCGAGSLSVEKSEQAMDMVNELSKRLKERFKA